VSDERTFYVYILASRPWGTLYIGITNDLLKRVFQHKEGLVEGFTKTYSVKTLVHWEEFATAFDAIHREKRLKKWPRAWKITLIRAENPDWNDLAAEWYPKEMTAEDIDNWLAKVADTRG
jgi:putative endonuclease